MPVSESKVTPPTRKKHVIVRTRVEVQRVCCMGELESGSKDYGGLELHRVVLPGAL